MCVQLNDMNRVAENGEGFGDGHGNGVVAAGEERNFSGAPLRGSEFAKRAGRSRPIRKRRQVAGVKNFSREVTAGFAGGVIAVAVVGETQSGRAARGAATKRGLRVVGEAGENEFGGGVGGKAASEGNGHRRGIL